MAEQKAPPRPRQVTMAAVMAAVGSGILVISLFDTLGRLRTPDTREEIGRFLSEPPGSSLDLEVAQVVDAMRVLAFVSGALAAAALVFAVFVLQRHVGARIGFTVTAALLVLTIPVAGLMPLFLVTAAALMWSRPARDWYAGRAPQPASEPRSAQQAGQQTGQQSGQQAGQRPDGAVPPAALPTSAEPSPVEPPPSGHLFGAPSRPEDHQSWQQQSWQQQPWQETQPVGQPTDPYGWAAQAPQGPAPVGPERRPATVTWAAVLTWLGTAAVAGVMLVLMAVLASGGDAFVDEFDRAASGTEVVLSRAEILAVGWAVSAILTLWSLAAAVLAAMAFRRSQAGRIGLVVSAAMAAMLSLVLVLSIVSLVTLFLSVTVIALLFMGGANDWFARRASPPPSQYPGQYPGPHGDHPQSAGQHPGPHGDHPQSAGQHPGQYPPPPPRERPKPW